MAAGGAGIAEAIDKGSVKAGAKRGVDRLVAEAPLLRRCKSVLGQD